MPSFFNQRQLLLALAILALAILSLLRPVTLAEAPPQAMFTVRAIDEQGARVTGARVLVGSLQTWTSDSLGQADLQIAIPADEVPVLDIAVIDEQHDRVGIYRASPTSPPDLGTLLEIPLLPSRNIPVTVKTPRGEPAADVQVGAIFNYRCTPDDSFPRGPTILVATQTDPQGNATLRIPRDAELNVITASRADIGFEYAVIQPLIVGADPIMTLPESAPLEITLAPVQTVQVKVTDPEGVPLPDVYVEVDMIHKADILTRLRGYYLHRTQLMHGRTDPDGLVTLPGIPTTQEKPLRTSISAAKYAGSSVHVPEDYDSETTLTVTMRARTRISGQLFYPDGNPASNKLIHCYADGYQSQQRSTLRELTDDQGHFEFYLKPDQACMLVVIDEQWGAVPVEGLITKHGEAIDNVSIDLVPTTRVHGRWTYGEDNIPVADKQMTLWQTGYGPEQIATLGLPNPTGSDRQIRLSLEHYATTNEHGDYEFFIGPGTYMLYGPLQFTPQEFTITTEQELHIPVECPRADTGAFTGQVVTGNPPRPVAGAVLEGCSLFRGMIFPNFESGFTMVADEHGHFAEERQLFDTLLCVSSPDGQLATALEIGPDDNHFTISVKPLARATGQLIDEKTSELVAHAKVMLKGIAESDEYRSKVHNALSFEGTSDEQGYFEFDQVVSGVDYVLHASRSDRGYELLARIAPQAGEDYAVGPCYLTRPGESLSVKQRLEKEFAAQTPWQQRYETAVANAKRQDQHLLLVFINLNDSPVLEHWNKLRSSHVHIKRACHNYQVLHLDAEAEDVQQLAARLGANLNGAAAPIWWFGTAEGQTLHTGPIPLNPAELQIDRGPFLAALEKHTPEQLDARELLDKALAEAEASNRRVLIQATATWCGPCHRLSRHLEHHRSTWERDYIWLRIDERWLGSKEVMQPLRGNDWGGIPWYAILDSEGNTLITSDGPNGNIGYPLPGQQMDHFIHMFTSTAERISSSEMEQLREPPDSTK